MTAVLADHDAIEHRTRRAPVAALGFATFVYVTAETLPVGLLPQISHGLSVSEADVGLLLTSYAVVAGLTAIPFTALTVRIARHRLIALCLGVFTVSQFLAAAAPTFAVLVGARLVAALAHGVFWSAIAPVAARLAPPGQAGRATSLVFVGNSVAIVTGVPLGTALGQLAGWRVAILVLAVAGVGATAAIVRVLPELDSLDTTRRSALHRVRSSLTVLGNGQVAAVCGVTTVVVIGQFAAWTYVAPLVRAAGGVSGLGLSALLLGYGAAGVLGNLLAGRTIDRRPGPALGGYLAVLAAGLAWLAISPGMVGTVLAVLAWGVGFSAVPVSLQSAILRVAPDAQDAASAVYVVAFQIGIGGGALVGEQLIAGGALGAIPVFATVASLAALAMVLGARRAFPRRVPA